MTSMSILSPRHELDKISQLPDDILLKVLCTLNLKNAVRMSILAKRWRYLWTWLTDLDFDPINLFPNNCHCMVPEEIRKEEYMNWVSRVVNAHRAPCISKFRVSFLAWIGDPSPIEKWVRFAISKKVEELDLDLALVDDADFFQFSLGSDILKHPLDNGIFNLKSLRLSSVHITGETLEFILLQCHLLERLHVEDSDNLHTTHILSYKLKHLTLMNCLFLKVLQIDAVNLISFHFEECLYGHVFTNVVFKNVPKLVEVGLELEYVLLMFCLLGRSRVFFLASQTDIIRNDCPVEINVVFPIVKQLSLTVESSDSVFIKLFLYACPMLRELKLQVKRHTARASLEEEAKQLQEIEVEDEGNDMMSIDDIPYPVARKRDLHDIEREPYQNNTIHPNLKVLEIVGFHGSDADVEFALHIIACANSFERLICDPRHYYNIGSYWDYEDVKKTNIIRKRALKLVKLLPPNVHVGVRDKSGLLMVS